MKRILKQILYGLFYLAVWTGIFAGIYFWFIKPSANCYDGVQNSKEEGVDCGGGCPDICLPPDFKPLAARGDIRIVNLNSGASVLVQVQNLNTAQAAKEFQYELTLYGDAGGEIPPASGGLPLEKGELIKTITGEDFIYAGELKYLSFPRIANIRIAKAEFKFDEPQWVPAAEFVRPQIRLERAQTLSSESGVEVSGRFMNDDTLTLARVTAVGLLYNMAGELVGITRTEIENTEPKTARDFILAHPPVSNLDASRTQVYVYGWR